ncbi:MAG: hypothetical protein JO210_04050 [Acidobacteriaceae bacterium]|nr:hypothetical protein [Acidobacteriaceae bacterium]
MTTTVKQVTELAFPGSTYKRLLPLMKTFTNAALAAVLIGMPAYAAPHQSSGQSSTSQNSQDVPHQQPGDNNPDVGKQRQHTPEPSTGESQQKADVPHQKPSTDNPDVGKQRHPTPKKNKKNTSTSSSTQP